MANRIFVATRKGLFTLDRAANGWKVSPPAFLGDHVSLVMHDPRDGIVYAALRHGHFGCKLHRSRDAGKSWEEIAAPAYPPQPEGLKDTDGFGKPLPWKVDTIWAMEPGGKDQPGVLWLGCIPGGLFRSNDNGASWTFIDSLWSHPTRKKWFGGGADLPGIHSICVDPRDSKHLTLGVSCGGVWDSKDAGATWENCPSVGMYAEYMPPEGRNDPAIQDPHIVVQCQAQPDCLWVQHHNGIFRSTDRSATWQAFPDVKPSNFGFAVAVHPRDPKTAWFVPAIKDEKRIPVDGQVVVTRTRDGGKSFQILRNGLPQENAYDLTFRHALDVDETGDGLAFGSTTGSFWTSANGGDSWHALPAHLPPVYCVRFAK